MATRFRHAALVGKFNAEGIREELESVAAFLVAKGLAVTLEEALDDEGTAQTINFTTADTMEAMSAFVAKRDPRFTGR